MFSVGSVWGGGPTWQTITDDALNLVEQAQAVSSSWPRPPSKHGTLGLLPFSPGPVPGHIKPFRK